jgi:small-conductance mechanosensitive channel
MMRIAGALFLATVLLLGAAETNQTAAAATVQRDLTAATVRVYNQEIAELDRKLRSIDSAWIKALDAFVLQQSLQGRLAQVDLNLQNPETAKDARAVKRFESEKSLLLSEMKRVDGSLVEAIEYYVRPQSEQLSVHTDMYKHYESSAQELEQIKSLLQQKQKRQNELLRAGKGAKGLQDDLKATSFALDTVNKIQQRINHLSDARLTRINELNRKNSELKEQLEKSNIWQKSYTAYLTYLDVKKDLAALQEEINAIDASEDAVARTEERDALLAKQKILSDQLSLLQTHGTSPFADLLKPEEIEAQPEITNPLDIFSGFSYNKKVRQQLHEYIKRGDELKKYLQLLLKSRENYARLSDLDADEDYSKEIAELDTRIEKYQTAYSTLQDTANVYGKRIEEIELKINTAIEEQLYKLANIGGIILFLLVFFFIMKQIAKKYISDNERFYMANKVITFANVTLILLVLLFNYIENVSYVVTVLGFASAGIAIAMKDWFMSMLGWLVIVFGGSIHVGDRVRVDKDGKQYVGDVLDISMLRITILEDITLTTYTHNRRAGRIIFIPNNYIFTEMIANYTHVSLKTVWDGIDITVTFDSNHKKAQHIAKEITRKFAKGYTDITRNQLNKLRSRYNLKNTNVEPRIYAFAEENGIRISAWYLTNAYATLTLRSTISMEILDAYGKEDDITIAYPTQRLRLQNEPLPQPVPEAREDGEVI